MATVWSDLVVAAAEVTEMGLELLLGREVVPTPAGG